jgi:hypothetical protein
MGRGPGPRRHRPWGPAGGGAGGSAPPGCRGRVPRETGTRVPPHEALPAHVPPHRFPAAPLVEEGNHELGCLLAFAAGTPREEDTGAVGQMLRPDKQLVERRMPEVVLDRRERDFEPEGDPDPARTGAGVRDPDLPDLGGGVGGEGHVHPHPDPAVLPNEAGAMRTEDDLPLGKSAVVTIHGTGRVLAPQRGPRGPRVEVPKGEFRRRRTETRPHPSPVDRPPSPPAPPSPVRGHGHHQVAGSEMMNRGRPPGRFHGPFGRCARTLGCGCPFPPPDPPASQRSPERDALVEHGLEHGHAGSRCTRSTSRSSVSRFPSAARIMPWWWLM